MNAFLFVVCSNNCHCSYQYPRQFVNFMMFVKYSDTLVLYTFFLKSFIEINFSRINIIAYNSENSTLK
jgi:hypothetical protein